MVGWIVSNADCDASVESVIRYKNWFFGYTSNGKFLDDKIFLETKTQIICLDGVILNSNKLKGCLEWEDTVKQLINQNDMFPDLLRGSFNGFIFDKITCRLEVFVDHLGERPVFYLDDEHLVVISSNYNMLAECLARNNYKKELDVNAVKYMLSFGYMIDDSTYIQNVKRVMPGYKLAWEMQISKECLRIDKECYHIFTNKQETKEDDNIIIKKLDTLFRNAVDLQMSKDAEYGKVSLIDLSGGLDCRLINYVARDLGYTNILNLSFSQVGSNEHKVTMMLSQDLRSDLLFFPLNNANYITAVDEIVKHNYGLSLYSTTTGIMNTLKYLNYSNIGIEHGGLLGDMYEGTMPGGKYKKHEPASFEKGMRFSSILPNSELDKTVIEKYDNNEIFTVYGRGLLAGYSTVMIRQHYNEFISPYGDVDFYDYFLSIPLHKRVVEKITIKWIEKCYPEAFNVVYDKTMCRINAKKCIVETKEFFTKVRYKLMSYLKIPCKNNMNPMEYWYKSNSEFRDFINDYYNNYIDRMSVYPQVKEYMELVFSKGNVRDKTMVLTAMSAIKEYLV